MLSGKIWPAHPHPLPDELLTSWMVRLAEANGIRLQALSWMLFGNAHSPWNRDADRSAPKWLIKALSRYSGVGYLFVNGGPYNPADEIPERFSGIVSDEIINEVIDELHGEVGEMWAPIDYSPDYDEYLAYEPHTRDEPGIAFNKRLGEIERVLRLTSQADPQTANLLEQMALGSVISAVEAFLAEITTYWAIENETVLQRVAAKELRDRKFTLAEIFDRPKEFKETVLTHLAGNVVWHRLDKLKPTIEHGLQINLPDISVLMSAVNVRHDIVHRAGRTKEGAPITLSSQQVNDLCTNAREFVMLIEAELNRSFPRESDEEDF